MATPYQRTSPIGVPGGMLSFNPGDTVDKGYASVPIAAGLAICEDANGRLTPLDPTSSLTFKGIALTTRIGFTTGDTYAIGDVVPFGVKYNPGVTLTGSEDAVVGGTVYRVPATGAISADSTGNIEIDNCTFTHAGSDGDVVGVRIDKVS